MKKKKRSKKTGQYRIPARVIRKILKFWRRFILLVLLLLPLGNGESSDMQRKVTLTLRNANLDKVLREISKQTGYSFVYSQSKLLRARKVTIKVENSSLDEVLGLCFKDQPLTYTIVGKTVILKPRGEKTVVISLAKIISNTRKLTLCVRKR